MKALKYLALLLLALTLVYSCSSDDDITSDDTTQTTGDPTGDGDDTDDGNGDDGDTTGDGDDTDDGNGDDGDTTDDGDDDTTPDPIVGTWTLTSAITIRNNQQTPVNLTDCQKQSTFAFSADQNVTLTNITGNAEPCTTANPRTSAWENNEDGTYKINIITSIFSNTTPSATLEGDTLTVISDRFEIIDSGGRLPTIIRFQEEERYTRVP